MKILITGMNGTVAPVMAAWLRGEGYEVMAWNRNRFPIAEREDIRAAFDEVNPDAVFHIATGPLSWTEWIAQEVVERKLRFLHTSSVSVYGAHQFGPLTPDVIPEPDDAYGSYKLEGEKLIQGIAPTAQIYRIGWQIGDAPGSNNMVDFFHRQHLEFGVLRVSRYWIPASSYLPDTAEAMGRQFFGGKSGLYHVDGNPGFSLYDLAMITAQRLQMDWKIEPVDEPVRDNRMIDARISLRQLVGMQ